MPPHCDTLDGPVVVAARSALDADDVDLALPFVPVDNEDEVRAAFELARKARTQGPEAREVADLYFFDTTVRVHRRGEGAPHTGLKPAGLDIGPVIPLAEQAVDTAMPVRSSPSSSTRPSRPATASHTSANCRPARQAECRLPAPTPPRCSGSSCRPTGCGVRPPSPTTH